MADIISQIYYEGTLITELHDNRPNAERCRAAIRSFTGNSVNGCHLLLNYTNTCVQRLNPRTSKFNVGEQKVTLEVAVMLMEHGIPATEIKILTPYKDQKLSLTKLKKFNNATKDIGVDTIDPFFKMIKHLSSSYP